LTLLQPRVPNAHSSMITFKWNHMDQRVSLPPTKDCASTSAVKAVLGLPLCRSSARCSPSTFLHLPYRKLCRMSEVITSDSERLGHLNPDLRTKASAGSTEPMLQIKKKKNPAKWQQRLQLQMERFEKRKKRGKAELLLSASFCSKPSVRKAALPGCAGSLYISGQCDPCLITY